MAKWQHNPISAKAGAPAANGRPIGFAWEHDKTQHVVYRGQDNQIHELWYKKGLFNAEWKYGGALSAMTGAPAAAGDPSAFAWEGDKTQHIVYRGQDNQIHEIWFKKDLSGAKWQYGGALSAKTGAPAAASDPFGYAWEGDHTQHVIYRGVDNNIHEIFCKKNIAGAKWEYGGAINAKAIAPAAAGDPSGFAWEQDKTQHIIYRGQDNQIHELWYRHGLMDNSWKYGGALSAKTGAPSAASNPMGFSWDGDHTQHVVYRSADNQIQELWFSKSLASAEWKYGGAISAKAGAQAGTGDPFGFAWEGDKTQHLLYRTQDNQILELWFRKEMFSAEWKNGGALSAMAGAPQAASDPIGFAWEEDKSQHVIYRGQDNQVHELWMKK